MTTAWTAPQYPDRICVADCHNDMPMRSFAESEAKDDFPLRVSAKSSRYCRKRPKEDTQPLISMLRRGSPLRTFAASAKLSNLLTGIVQDKTGLSQLGTMIQSCRSEPDLGIMLL